MDCGNKADFTDDNTILYAHNMKDRSMFGSLGDTADGEIRLFSIRKRRWIPIRSWITGRLPSQNRFISVWSMERTLLRN